MRPMLPRCSAAIVIAISPPIDQPATVGVRTPSCVMRAAVSRAMSGTDSVHRRRTSGRRAYNITDTVEPSASPGACDRPGQWRAGR
jgi:hypothetical protein